MMADERWESLGVDVNVQTGEKTRGAVRIKASWSFSRGWEFFTYVNSGRCLTYPYKSRGQWGRTGQPVASDPSLTPELTACSVGLQQDPSLLSTIHTKALFPSGTVRPGEVVFPLRQLIGPWWAPRSWELGRPAPTATCQSFA